MKYPSSKAVWGAVLALALWWPSPALAQSGPSRKLDKALRASSSSGQSVDVIVRAKAGREASVTDKVGRHSSDAHVHSLIGAVSATLSPAEIADLVNDPDVDGLSIDADVSASAAGSQKGSSNHNGGATSVVGDVKQLLGLDNWYTGSTATVAIIDSGVAQSQDFDTRILAQFVFSNGQPAEPSMPYDDYGHGTHVAGVIGSNGSSSNNKYAGIAPGVKILALKVLDRQGTGKTSDVINALEFAVANKSRYGITLINLSLGHPIYESATTDPLVQAVEAAVRAGIVVVVASGNYGYNPLTGTTGYAGIASPGNAPSAITVGAAMTNNTVTRADDRLADYSSRGPTWYDGFAKPDILAPGEGLVSTDAIGSTLDSYYPSLIVQAGTKRYLRLSGSSMATAVVSGLAALIFDANQAGAEQRWQDYQNSLRRNERTSFEPSPSLSSNALKAFLEYSATPIHNTDGVQYGPLEQGTGLANGAGALALAYYTDTRKAAGQFWLTSQPAPSTNFGGIDEPWAQTVIWGTRLLHGTSVVDLRQAAWEDNIVWGTGAFTNIVWGMFSADEDNIVWGTLALDEDNIVWGTSVPLSTAIAWAGNAMLEDNIVWGTAAVWEDNIVWGSGLIGVFNGQNIVWGTFSSDEDNIVWGTLDEDNIVWGTSANKVSVLGAMLGGVL